MKRVKEFLKTYWDGQSPLLVGYSGGPDSKALLYSLLESGCQSLHVAHVDHGWREESKKEAEEIREEIEKLGLPFYTTCLSFQADANKEAVARRKRLEFFQSLFKKTPFQALVLGHHADDLAETALKRIFEGAHLPWLGGMESITQFEKMPIWRPLLTVNKEKLQDFLKRKKLIALQDSTNFDPIYLRSRLRLETLPFLHRSFGKNIGTNLCYLSERASELKAYLDKKVDSNTVQRGDWGVAVCPSGMERIEKRYLIQKVSMNEKLSLPRSVLESLLDWVEDRSKMRKIFLKSHWIVCSKGWVLFLRSDKTRIFPGNAKVREWVNSFFLNGY